MELKKIQSDRIQFWRPQGHNTHSVFLSLLSLSLSLSLLFSFYLWYSEVQGSLCALCDRKIEKNTAEKTLDLNLRAEEEEAELLVNIRFCLRFEEIKELGFRLLISLDWKSLLGSVFWSGSLLPVSSWYSQFLF